MKFCHIITALLAFVTLSLAWPWPPTLPDIQAFRKVEEFLGKRQDNGGNNNSGGSNNSNSNSSGGNNNSGGSVPASTTSGNPTSTHSGDSRSSITPPPKSGSQPSETNSSGGSSQTSGGDSSSSNSTDSSTTSLASISGNVAGGVNMITPGVTAATQYYSVGSTITWVWNYTSLARPPKRIDIVASMSATNNMAVQSPFTLALNQSFSSTQNFTWDTNKFASQTPLGVGIYALQVYDADVDGGVSATPSPGHLGVNNAFQFGMYTGQQYTALANPYVCATCNAASSLMQPSTLKMVLGTSALMMGTFVYFGIEFGALW